MVDYHKFAKVSLAKLPCLILNNIINIQIHVRLFYQLCFVVNSSKFALAKVSFYALLCCCVVVLMYFC